MRAGPLPTKLSAQSSLEPSRPLTVVVRKAGTISTKRRLTRRLISWAKLRS